MPARFDPSRAAQLVRAARDDRGLSQAELAASAGMSQPHIAAIESDRRKVGPEVLERILRAADYRPSVALESQSDAVVRAGARHGIHNIRVFGSTGRGADHFTSDIDLLAEVEAGRGYFDIGAFIVEVERLTGFPVDLIVDGPGAPEFLSSTELVAVSEPPADRNDRFVAKPRVPTSPDDGVDHQLENFRDSLEDIESYLSLAMAGGREAFVRRSGAYASGSVAITRAAALFEVSGFERFLSGVDESTALAIATTRNIADHAGYRAMDDDRFWLTLNVHLPQLLYALRAANGL